MGQLNFGEDGGSLEQSGRPPPQLIPLNMMVKTECLGKYDICNETESCRYSAICSCQYLEEHEDEIQEHKPWYNSRTLYDGRQEPEGMELGRCRCKLGMRRVLNLGKVSLCMECIIKLYDDARGVK